jgi:hypothetical protein
MASADALGSTIFDFRLSIEKVQCQVPPLSTGPATAGQSKSGNSNAFNRQSKIVNR